MPIPDFYAATGMLPAGEYLASLDEIRDRFMNNYRRREIFNGLTHVVDLLLQKRVTIVWVDGSFVTDKQRPNDVDVVYVPPAGANTDTWDILAFDKRDHLKRFHRVDLWPYPSYQPSSSSVTGRISIKQFFESKNGIAKGILRLELGANP